MKTELATVRVMLAYQDVWFSHFPTLSRRAEWHIVCHLCVKGRSGSPVGELYGLVKQIFLMDDATVKERLLTIGQMGYCELDPPGPVFSRTVVMPTEALLTRFDAHLIAFAAKLATLPNTEAYIAPEALSPVTRAQLLRILDLYAAYLSDAIDAIFDLGSLSPARRGDAKRHMNSSSHWNLLHHAVLWQLEGESGAKGILADRLAARILELTGQSLQTTKDHIGYLIEIDVFRRMKGKALHVALTDLALRLIGDALAQTAQEVPGVLGLATRSPMTRPSDMMADRTLKHRTVPDAAPTPKSVLEVVVPVTDRRRIEVETSMIFGRAQPSDVVLNSGDISRAHCRVAFEGGRLTVTDLNSTNGTFVNDAPISSATVLAPGDRIRIGSYVLLYAGDTFEADATVRGRGFETPAGFSET